MYIYQLAWARVGHVQSHLSLLFATIVFTTLLAQLTRRTMGATSPIMTDLAIIGGGPAGLAAALMFARLKRPAVVYDSKLYRNADTNSSHTIPGFDGQDPMVYKAKVRADIERDYGEWVKFKDVKVVNVKKNQQGKRFELEDVEGDKMSARKVIIASGIQDNLPAIPGQ
jgi:thioredoxin reductase